MALLLQGDIYYSKLCVASVALLPTCWVDFNQMLYLYLKSPLCIGNRDNTTKVILIFKKSMYNK